jgi:glycosyltransferase 2 family protein
MSKIYPLKLKSWLCENKFPLFKVIFVIIIFLFISIYVLKNLDELKGADISFNFYYLSTALLLTVFYVFNYSLIWQYITIKNGCSIELRKAVAIRVYSEFGKYIPGRALSLAMTLYFYDREKKSKKLVGYCLFLEYLATLLGAIFVFLCSVFFVEGDAFERYKSVAAVLMGVFFVMMHPKILERCVNTVLKRTKYGEVVFDITYVQVLIITLLNVINWVLLGIAFFLFINSVYSIAIGHFAYIMGLLTLASFSGLISIFTPAGLGVREGIMIFLLAAIVPKTVAIVISVGSRLLIVVAEIILFGIVYLYNRLVGRKRLLAEEAPENGSYGSTKMKTHDSVVSRQLSGNSARKRF